MVIKLEYQSLEDLYKDLKGAFNVKLRLIGEDYKHIKAKDIWDYLRIHKWSKDKGLTLSEMVNDIIEVDIKKVDIYRREKISKDVIL